MVQRQKSALTLYSFTFCKIMSFTNKICAYLDYYLLWVILLENKVTKLDLTSPPAAVILAALSSTLSPGSPATFK